MAKRPANSAAILEIVTEMAAVGILALIAGINDKAGNIVFFIVGGAWLLYGVTNSKTLFDVMGAFSDISQNPTNNPNQLIFVP